MVWLREDSGQEQGELPALYIHSCVLGVFNRAISYCPSPTVFVKVRYTALKNILGEYGGDALNI